MKVKCGREEFNLTEEDLIMFNGKCYQIVTREIPKGWHRYSPVLAKAKAAKLIKDGLLILAHEKQQYPMTLKYYKINTP